MTDTYNDIEDKAEDAVATFLAAAVADVDEPHMTALSGLSILKGLSLERIRESHVAIVAEESEEANETDNIGNFAVKVRLSVKSHMSERPKTEMRALHRGRVGALNDFALRTDFVSQLNSLYTATPFHAMAWTSFKKARRVEGKWLITDLEGTLLCMGSDAS